MIRDFAAVVETLVVVEELDPFLEEQVRAWGLEVIGKKLFPATGELTLARVREGALKAGLPIRERSQVSGARSRSKSQGEPETVQPETLKLDVPVRPPALCPGCPHRSVYFNLRKRKMLVAGDIGCYAIGVLPPFEEMDMLISMGASIGMAHGARQAGCSDRVIATIGDSTFFHSALP